MRNLVDYIKEQFGLQEPCVPILEMATISRKEKWGNKEYKIALHGTSQNDRPYPHVHIYYSTDNTDKPIFNFEVSLVDILCYDEINLVRMKNGKKDIKNKDKCSRSGYKEIRDGFEDWLFAPCKMRGDFKNNLDALCWSYNNESNIDNALKTYLDSKGLVPLDKYKEYIEQD